MFRADEDAAQRSHQALRGLGLIAAVVVSLATGPARAGVCPADLNGSGMVGTDDLLILLANWGECPVSDPCPVPGDINGDGTVDVDDLLILLADWGQCPAPPPPPACLDNSAGCCVVHPGAGCEDAECCQAVCACDPFCCDVQWDGYCAGDGFEPDCLCGPNTCGVNNTEECAFCNGWPCLPRSDCSCDTPAGVGCPSHPACEACVCDDDPFCCEIAWDSICANHALCECANICCGAP